MIQCNTETINSFGDAGTGDAQFRVDGDGDAICDSGFTGSGADYAEMFEWNDGNPNNEDRRGYTVSLINNKIKIAEEGDTVIGVVSVRPSMLGNVGLQWNKK